MTMYVCIRVNVWGELGGHKRSLTSPSSQGWAFRCPVIDCLIVCLFICRYVVLFKMWVGSIFLLFLNILVCYAHSVHEPY